MVKMNFQNPTETSYIRSLIFLRSHPDVKPRCAFSFSVIALKRLNETSCFRYYGATFSSSLCSQGTRRVIETPTSVTFHCPTDYCPSQKALTQHEWCQGHICSATQIVVRSHLCFPTRQGAPHKNGTYPVTTPPQVPTTSGPGLRTGFVLWFYSYQVDVIQLIW